MGARLRHGTIGPRSGPDCTVGPRSGPDCTVGPRSGPDCTVGPRSGPAQAPIAPSGPDRAPIAPSGPDWAPIVPSGPCQGAIELCFTKLQGGILSKTGGEVGPGCWGYRLSLFWVGFKGSPEEKPNGGFLEGRNPGKNGHGRSTFGGMVETTRLNQLRS